MLTQRMLQNVFLKEIEKHKVESLTNFINELQQQAHGQRLENAHHGYVESRREQVRLQEESVMKEKALRETLIPTISRDGRIEESSRITS